MSKKYCFLLFFLLFFSAKSQYSIRKIHPESLYQNAFLEYENENFLWAAHHFETLEKRIPKNDDKEFIDYYKVLSIIKNGSKNADFWIDYFIKNYPTSIFKNNFLLEIGQYYYHSKNATLALKWLKKVDKKFLNQPQEDAYNFMMGYAFFLEKKYTQAKAYFLPLTYRKHYKENACYYYGYIAYSQLNHSEALRYFKRMKSPSLKKMVAYYKMVIFYLEKKYGEVIKIKKEIKEVSDAYLGGKGLAKKVNLIVAHSYFQMKQYEKAALLFEKVLKNNPEDYWHDYICGYAFFQIKNYQNTLQHFMKVVSFSKIPPEILQNTIYNMGICHMNLGEKNKALLDFGKASGIYTKKTALQKDAYFEYAKLGYEIGNPYQNPTKVLKNYVQKYPHAANTLAIKKLIVDSYFKTQDFKGTLQYYEKAKIPADGKKQKAFLFLGMQNFREGTYNEALLYFEKASNQLFNSQIRNQALYWKASTLYELKKFKKALFTYIQFKKRKKAKTLPIYQNIDYDIGYAYFKMKKYENAAKYFEKYLQKESEIKESRKINDAYLRLADAYFAIKSYKKAIKNYDYILLSSTSQQDYAGLQKALCYGFMGNQKRKIQILTSFIIQYPKSTYNDEVLFILGNTYLQNGHYKDARVPYEKIIKLFGNSPFFASCMLKKGLIYYNLNQSEKALKQYKSVVEKFPKTPIAKQAIADIKRIYVETDKVEEYARWVKHSDFLDVSEENLDDTMYQAAESLYLENKKNKAVESFEKYLSNFPKGVYHVKVHFYLGELYFDRKNWERALLHYHFVLKENTNNYSYRSLAKLSEIYLQKGDWEQAFSFLEKILEQADSPEIVVFAKKNLVKATFRKKMYQKCIHYAKDLLDTESMDATLTNQMHLFIAQSAMALKNFTLAKNVYLNLSKNAMGSIRAEAMYYEAYFLYKDKKYKKSNEKIQKIANTGTWDSYWNTQSLLLMARNYKKLNDTFQAIYILEQLSKNKEIPKTLAKEIHTFLEKIKSKPPLKNELE